MFDMRLIYGQFLIRVAAVEKSANLLRYASGSKPEAVSLILGKDSLFACIRSLELEKYSGTARCPSSSAPCMHRSFSGFKRKISASRLAENIPALNRNLAACSACSELRHQKIFRTLVSAESSSVSSLAVSTIRETGLPVCLSSLLYFTAVGF